MVLHTRILPILAQIYRFTKNLSSMFMAIPLMVSLVLFLNFSSFPSSKLVNHSEEQRSREEKVLEDTKLRNLRALLEERLHEKLTLLRAETESLESDRRFEGSLLSFSVHVD
eukprot:TRINITY_DN2426_c0_g1_i21.p2 TRINITY_DN2426_c0_g1~~TRINITY_DN2426_c0_g1_i21.p2  ORF type:complete len:112 (-),score=18.22 TRINITY_DN2426_c0_g1_i21:275-610(-)